MVRDADFREVFEKTTTFGSMWAAPAFLPPASQIKIFSNALQVEIHI
jgi:hypothetical protein